LEFGKLNITTTTAQEIQIKILPPLNGASGRKVETVDDKLNITLDDSAINEKAVVDLKLPKGTSTVYVMSKEAEISAKGMRGFLSIDASGGKTNIESFNGDLYLVVSNTSVKARGVFKALDIENENADVDVTLTALPPGLHYYDIHGNGGNVVLTMGAGIDKKKVKIGETEFSGTLTVK